MSMPPKPDSHTSEFLWDVHKYTNDYIRFADTKAAFTASVVTALIGSLVASSILDSCFRIRLWRWSPLQWVTLLGLILLTGSLVLCIAAIRPRLWNNTPVGFIFWDSIVAHKTAHQFTRALHALTDRQRSEVVSDHLFILATIAKRKFEYVGWAIYAGAIGGMLAGIALFLHHTYR